MTEIIQHLGINTVSVCYAGAMPNKLPRIDDPVDASYFAWPEEGEITLGDLTVTALSPVYQPAHLVHALKELFSGKSRHDRVLYLLNGFRLKVSQMESRVEKLENKPSIQENVQAPQFKEALYLAMEETSRTLHKGKIDRFAAVLANAVRPDERVDSAIDLSTLIRDIAQLTDDDIRVLNTLYAVYADVIAHYPNLHDPNVFTEKMDDLRRAITNSNLHTDDFRAICERLSGFGLAAEVLRNTSRMGLNDYCYRPTLRGIRLLTLLR